MMQSCLHTFCNLSLFCKVGKYSRKLHPAIIFFLKKGPWRDDGTRRSVGILKWLKYYSPIVTPLTRGKSIKPKILPCVTKGEYYIRIIFVFRNTTFRFISCCFSSTHQMSTEGFVCLLMYLLESDRKFELEIEFKVNSG